MPLGSRSTESSCGTHPTAASSCYRQRTVCENLRAVSASAFCRARPRRLHPAVPARLWQPLPPPPQRPPPPPPQSPPQACPDMIIAGAWYLWQDAPAVQERIHQLTPAACRTKCLDNQPQPLIHLWGLQAQVGRQRQQLLPRLQARTPSRQQRPQLRQTRQPSSQLLTTEHQSSQHQAASVPTGIFGMQQQSIK